MLPLNPVTGLLLFTESMRLGVASSCNRCKVAPVSTMPFSRARRSHDPDRRRRPSHLYNLTVPIGLVPMAPSSANVTDGCLGLALTGCEDSSLQVCLRLLESESGSETISGASFSLSLWVVSLGSVADVSFTSWTSWTIAGWSLSVTGVSLTS